MSQEKINLLNLLFTEEESALYDSNVDFDAYLNKMGSLKCEELIKEPSKLKDEKHSVTDQMQELAIVNYKTFIQTADCSRNLFQGFNSIENKLDHLLENIPQFEQTCHTFATNTSGINLLRRLNSLTLTRTAQLLEVLEIPQLMDSFIKDGLYEDALELAAYVRRLYAKHPDILIFKNILGEINKSWLIMLHHLLKQLKEDLQLSRCLQIVSYLRRMEVFTEAELRLKFLQAREAWLKQCLSKIVDTNAMHHINKTIEVTRVNLFNIITQYKAIFNDDDHGSVLSNKQQNINENVIFFSWIRDRIGEFLATLECDLNKEVTSIESILGQCMYFGLSFSRVGCDFRGSMVPIFNKAVLHNFRRRISKSSLDFEKNMERFTLINKNHPNVPWKTKISDPVQPPESLLEFYPLAEYLNQVLVAFNELRLCAPVAIVPDVIKCLEESLIKISKGILGLYGQEQQAFTANAKDAFMRLCLSFVDDLIPYIQKCVNIIYPSNYISSHINCSIQNLQKEGIILIDKSVIIEPLSALLPVKIEPVISNDDAEGSPEVSNMDEAPTLTIIEPEHVTQDPVESLL
ncbi:hypothetical protein PPYR_07784 [Photinus pyralis]|uniref:Conserved oligomeric Golgi complex subunit 8 n=1 Tax=Photinus pyralis TaxID=7054 RepID=A0A5N4ARF0_PHOPY|nr:conserved oligomeric Golgi complex subunit 8 [Photinus pyralis]KAB0799904.1 hypothetical protein PPYR_07784 [Photinus pyralis]